MLFSVTPNLPFIVMVLYIARHRDMMTIKRHFPMNTNGKTYKEMSYTGGQMPVSQTLLMWGTNLFVWVVVTDSARFCGRIFIFGSGK